MTDDILARAERAMEGVTVGPWEVPLLSDGMEYEDGSSAYRGSIRPKHRSASVCLVFGIDKRDAAFIAAARELVPELAAALREARAEVRVMADTEELLRSHRDDLRAERDEARAAIARVRAIHIEDEEGDGICACVTCMYAVPCPTIRALDGDA